MAALLVHGRDQDQRVMLDVAARLRLDDIAYVLPVAAGQSWYPGRYFDPLPVNQPWLDRALDACDAAIARAHRGGMADERIVMAGFSQGACVIAELVARRAPALGRRGDPDGDASRPGRRTSRADGRCRAADVPVRQPL